MRRLYAGPTNHIEVPVTGEMWEQATVAARASNNTTGLTARNSYYSPLERRERGYVCELAFAGYLGVDHELLLDANWQRTADVNGWEVKFMGWRKPKHMDMCEGGHLYVPDWTVAPKGILGMTLFDDTDRSRAFIDGYVTRDFALTFPRGGKPRRGPGGRFSLAHLVPYSDLLPFETSDARLRPTQQPLTPPQPHPPPSATATAHAPTPATAAHDQAPPPSAS